MKYLTSIVLLISWLGFAQINPDTVSQKTANDIAVLKDSLIALQQHTHTLLFRGKYDSVILSSIHNIKFAEDIGDIENAYYSRYMMAAAFMHLEDFKNAHLYGEDYLKFTKKTTDNLKMARAYNFIGTLYLTEKKYDSALPFFVKSLPLSLRRKDTLAVSIVYYNLSKIYLNQGQNKKAQNYFKLAKKGITAVDYKRMQTDMKLLEGKLQRALNNPIRAIENFNEAIASTKNGVFLDDTLIEVYLEYSNTLYSLNRFKEAYLMRKKFDSITQIRFEKEKLMAIQNAAAQFSVKEYKEQAQKAELEKKLISERAMVSNLLLFFFIGTAIIMGLFLIILFRSHMGRKKLTQSLKEKNQQLLKAKQEAEELAMAKSKFFSTVSHELRTPLYGVIGLATALLEDKSLKSHQTDLKHLKFSADYLLALINDVLQISKLESNTLKEVKTSFNLNELIQSIVSSFQYALMQNKNKIHVSISENIPQNLVGDRVRLSQILMNLVGNAVKFTSKGNIYILAQMESISNNKVTIKFSVEDTGVGIPKEKQKAIFEEFQQVDSENSKIQGTGLGLTIVKKLLEASNATISLESEPGKGATFSFALTFGIHKQSLESETAHDYNVLRGKKILVVDDNRINQIVTQKIVEKYGMHCTIADSGNIAIEKLKTNMFDLVLMDINMPGKDGMETTKEIRKFNKTIPIVALTAIEVEEMRTKIAASGMNAIIAKPYDTEEFLKIIHNNLINEVELTNQNEKFST
ncbi:tetratricopeptide repeat-containing hybrid sensor histidine kinase/response regulator [Aequorivita marisscotiae]|uniref:histidine kinase n=1 Tax=Aequorivita marisscotiae TaxID=3040348 RepID=A0ABY8KZP4_9FLAO|nr:ATP-binding protein [Aequorivita sp. Ant34-E75]WGF93306.1 ATP-binding protein [Aequorivita sp. Ant34-E75]